jgi:hypothetical protein
VTRKAIIQGEIHVAQRDRRSLLDRRTPDTDGLFIEGRSDQIKLEHASVGYVLFLLGYLSVEALYQLSGFVERLLPSRETLDIEDTAKQHGLEVDSEIDAELHEMWNLTTARRRGLMYIALLSMLCFSAFHPSIAPQAEFIPDTVLSTVVAAGTPLLYTALGIFGLGTDGQRDQIMAETIEDQSTANSHNEILVLCGDRHVPGISEHLRSMGWEVVDQRSSHPLARLTRLLG